MVEIPGNVGAVTAYDGNDIEILNCDGASSMFRLEDGTNIIFVDTETTEGYEDGAIQLAAYDVNGAYRTWVPNVLYYSSDGGTIDALFVDVNNKWYGAKPIGRTYGIITSYYGTTKVDGKSYYEYRVDCNDKTYSIRLDGTKNNLKTGQLVSFMERADGCYTLEDITVYTEKNIQEAWVKDYNEIDNIITIYTALTENSEGWYEGSRVITYAVAENPHIIYVNARDNTVGEDIGINPFDSIMGYKNIAFLLNEKNEVSVVFVETSGKCDILP